MRTMLQFICVLLAWAVSSQSLAAELRVAVTTSFNNSGLSDVLLPEIKVDLGIDVQLLVVGTGQALRLGRAGDVDAILVHSKSAEERFVSEGFGVHRREIMYNDFVIVGPSDDPAKIEPLEQATEALLRVRNSESLFVSRGDDSGTHKKEIALWQTAGLDPTVFDPTWYRATGTGMGASLNTASAMNAYIMSDRASWLKFANKGDLKLLLAGDPVLFNQYAYLPVDPEKHPHTKFENAKKLEDWLVSTKAQNLIGAYQFNNETLFIPNAKAE